MKQDMKGINRRKPIIAVVGISQGVGATFIATSLAFLLSKFVENSGIEDDCGDKEDVQSRRIHEIFETLPKTSQEKPIPAPGCVSYVEICRPDTGKSSVFFEAALDRRFGDRRFTDFFKLYERNEHLGRAVNLHKGINWVVWPPLPLGEDEEEREMRLAYAAALSADRAALRQFAGKMVIVDSPSFHCLKQYDLVVAVMDPLPSKVFAGAERYENLRKMQLDGMSVLWVVNRNNTAVNQKKLKRFFHLSEFFSVPLIEKPIFYEAQYSQALPIELIMVQNLQAEMEDLAESIWRIVI